jgi:hypothetical protein
MNKKEIGGFLELELAEREEYHKGAIRLNAARYCISQILKQNGFNVVYLPNYICDSVVNECKKANVEIRFYNINQNFLPDKIIYLQANEVILYVNYFGVNNKNVDIMARKYENIIIDNTQAFFYKNILRGPYYVYSARKFFGVSDGAYLYGDINIDEATLIDLSYERATYLLKRIDTNASNAYELFQKNETLLDDCGTKKMSQLTQKLLKSIDYDNIRLIRKNNFMFIHNMIGKLNKLSLDVNYVNGPMVYPLLIENEDIKAYLISNKVYVATYWNEVLNRQHVNIFEQDLVKKLIPIPLDQRYNLNDMKYICNLIMERLK